jgi:hypothetical protein
MAVRPGRPLLCLYKEGFRHQDLSAVLRAVIQDYDGGGDARRTVLGLSNPC